MSKQNLGLINFKYKKLFFITVIAILLSLVDLIFSLVNSSNHNSRGFYAIFLFWCSMFYFVVLIYTVIRHKHSNLYDYIGCTVLFATCFITFCFMLSKSLTSFAPTKSMTITNIFPFLYKFEFFAREEIGNIFEKTGKYYYTVNLTFIIPLIMLICIIVSSVILKAKDKIK